MSKQTKHDVERELSQEETTPLQDDEKEIADKMMSTLTEEERKLVTPMDILTIIRGYKTYVPRQEETNNALRRIVDWRKSVDYSTILKRRIDGDEEFHKLWEERIFGRDKYGHPLIGMHIGLMDTDALAKIETDRLAVLQGQKLAALNEYKRELSRETGTQRYKYSVVVDMRGLGMGVLSGKKRHIIQKLFAVGSDFFPESVWKIYVINTPLVFRAIWSVVKVWVHPITLAKVTILGSSKSTNKNRLMEDGFSEESLPDYIGGQKKEEDALAVWSLIQRLVENKTNTTLEDEGSSDTSADGTGSSADNASHAQPQSSSAPSASAPKQGDDVIGHLAYV